MDTRHRHGSPTEHLSAFGFIAGDRPPNSFPVKRSQTKILHFSLAKQHQRRGSKPSSLSSEISGKENPFNLPFISFHFEITAHLTWHLPNVDNSHTFDVASPNVGSSHTFDVAIPNVEAPSLWCGKPTTGLSLSALPFHT
jgi:hypothetical protein